MTGPGSVDDRWTPHDAGLAEELTSEILVHRIAGPEPAATARDARLERLFGIRSPWTRWWQEGVRALGAQVGEGIDLVWALMQPYASAVPAAAVARQLEVPWIADLADPWALDEMTLYPSALHRRRAQGAMRAALRPAAGIVMSTPEAVKRLHETFPELRDRPALVGPVGWRRDDFVSAPAPREDRAFRIVHTGYLHTQLGAKQRRSHALRRALGGARDGVDILARSHVYIVEALSRLLEDRPDLRGTIELHLAGVQTSVDRDVSAPHVDVRLLGYLDHPASVDLIRSADLLFLPMHDIAPGARAGLVPGKTYEYLAAGRPILAAIPDGDARDILVEAGNTLLARPTDTKGMRALIEAAVDQHAAGEALVPPRREVVERYEYAHLAEELEAFFERVLAC